MGDDPRGKTYVCRCEEIDEETMRQAISDGAVTINDVSRRTRAGMGICQGIFCTRAIAEMIHAQASVPLESIELMTARPPARLVTVSEFVAPEE